MIDILPPVAGLTGNSSAFLKAASIGLISLKQSG